MLALMVVINHGGGQIFGFRVIDSTTAVQTFFIISGFYMSLVLNEKYVKQNGSYKLFITNRFLRLYPLYWLVLILSVLFSCIIYLYVDRYINYGNHFAPNLEAYTEYFHSLSFGTFLLFVLSNIMIFFQDTLLFLKLNIITGNLELTNNFHNTTPILSKFIFVAPAWSISLELMFYLIAPFIVRKNLLSIGLLILTSLGLRLYIYSIGLYHDPWTYRFFPTELAFFLFGSFSYALYKRYKLQSIKPIYLNVSLIFTTLLIIFKSYTNSLASMTLFYFTVFIFLLPFIFIRTKNWKLDSYVGELSYPIYISHMLMFALVDVLDIRFMGKKGAIVILFTIIFSVLLNEFFIKRLEKIRQLRIKKRVSV